MGKTTSVCITYRESSLSLADVVESQSVIPSLLFPKLFRFNRQHSSGVLWDVWHRARASRLLSFLFLRTTETTGLDPQKNWWGESKLFHWSRVLEFVFEIIFFPLGLVTNPPCSAVSVLPLMRGHYPMMYEPIANPVLLGGSGVYSPPFEPHHRSSTADQYRSRKTTV